MPQRILGRTEIFIDTGRRDREFGQVRFANDLHVTLAGDCQTWRIGWRRLVRLLEKLRTRGRDHSLHLDVIFYCQPYLDAGRIRRPVINESAIPGELLVDKRRKRASATQDKQSQRYG